MNLLGRLLAWATPSVPVPPVVEIPRDRHIAQTNRMLADAWQRHIEAQVAEIQQQVGDLSVELALHELVDHETGG